MADDDDDKVEDSDEKDKGTRTGRILGEPREGEGGRVREGVPGTET